jgi:hypothetical protein
LIRQHVIEYAGGMHKRLVEILQAALGRFWSHVQLVGLDETDESTFRSFVLAEIHRRLPRCVACPRDGVWAGRPTFCTSNANVQMIGAVLHVTEIPHGHQNRLACLLLRVQ